MNWWSAFTIGFLTGGIMALLGARLFQEDVEEGAGESQEKKNGSIISKAFLHKVSQGPDIVAIGGGTGLSTLLSGLKYYTRNITAIVTVTDEGGSSGRLRGEWGVLPPGDIRNCMLALAEDDSSLNRLLNFRFDRGELKGHSLGNLILLAATEMTGDFRKAVEELNKLLAIRGKVIPVTNESVVLCAATADGDSLRGELDIARKGCRIESIWIEPADARAFPEAVAAIENADAVVLGPGSLFTSIIPNLMFREVSDALKRTAAPKIYITNLMTQPGETDGLSLMDHVRWITRASGTIPDYILVNEEEVPAALLEAYLAAGAVPLRLSEDNERSLSMMGSKLILSGFLDVTGGNVRHNSQKVSETLIRIAREEREPSRWKS
ncbi:MAG: gluconeogenesis factor YvcK family protein [Thermovirgaceae bacterium]|nr:YvcK family protein [Synergistales bacterium]HPC75108.1 YvcK family protein [Synergistales bacterium]HRS48420.1 YvcK family protein [Thermovirgaceae bacterium]HRU90350.1 YvcK family protein [Thermovirgaceae bacterium]